jgi:hypothetical protein
MFVDYHGGDEPAALAGLLEKIEHVELGLLLPALDRDWGR